jgi:hypothetical protein
VSLLLGSTWYQGRRLDTSSGLRYGDFYDGDTQNIPTRSVRFPSFLVGLAIDSNLVRRVGGF